MLKTFPSNANMWAGCPGSVLAESRYVRKPKGPEALEGDAAAWVAQSVLKSWKTEAPSTAVGMLGTTAPNGVIVTANIVDSVELYLETIWAVAREYPAGIECEVRADATWAIPGVAGRLDCRWTSQDGKRLHVWDYKNGVLPVPAYQNFQLICYGLGSLSAVTEHVDMWIVQPSRRDGLGPIRHWPMPVPELYEWAAYLLTRRDLVHSENPPTFAGTWCRYCAHAGDCDTLYTAGCGVIDEAGTPTATDLSDAQLAYQLQLFDRGKVLLRAKGDALEAMATARIAAGRIIPGSQVRKSLANRSWKFGPDRIAAFGIFLGVDLQEAKSCTPAEAERRGLSKEVVNTHTERKEGPAKLVRVDPVTIAELFKT